MKTYFGRSFTRKLCVNCLNSANYIDNQFLFDDYVFAGAADDSTFIHTPIYKVYPERWWVVISVLILDIANNAHWIAFPAVSQRCKDIP